MGRQQIYRPCLQGIADLFQDLRVLRKTCCATQICDPAARSLISNWTKLEHWKLFLAQPSASAYRLEHKQSFLLDLIPKDLEMEKTENQESDHFPVCNRKTGEDSGLRSKLFRWIPVDYRDELYQLLRLTGPLLASRLMNFLLPFTITIFCGHLGNMELAGYALASAVINVTTAATGFGLALACDTLVSQTFGGKNLNRVGEILQRSILILLLFCLPCWATLINSETILLALYQEAEVARIAQLYVVAFLPAVPAMFLHQLQVAYLQNQGIIWPQLYTAVAANVINVAVNYVLLFQMHLGVKGSAAANSISQIAICVLLYAFIRWKKLHVKTWGGWSTASLQEWGSFMQLAIPSTLMLCFEWWIYEIGGFLAGMLGEIDLGVQHVVLELGAITYMFPLGINAATCVRVGNALGAGEIDKAIMTSKVSLVLAALLAVVLGAVVGSTKSVIGYIFTSDEMIVQMVSEVMNVYIPLQFFDALVCVALGIILGAGKQKIAAVSNLIGYYCIGLPLGISLMFAAKLRVFGLWLGLLICVFLQTTFFIALILKMNWKQVMEEAQVRAGKTVRVTRVGMKPPIGEALTDGLSTESSGHTSEQKTVPREPGGSRICTYTAVRTEERGGLALEVTGDPEGDTREEEVNPRGLLSLSQLVWRRGLVLLAGLGILAIGIIMHLIFPPDVLAQARGNFSVSLEASNLSSPLPWDNFTTLS
ncbi:multidrug and toxin extrusion protein 1 isoform X2 [Lepisosteus oculatus]|uniref:multidrug and toxin extrusion protein 1 isoform X2 n=1 Tax=Lepisosteus oculatus TaxID=7918 RepID=UPI00073FDBD3|nr:PREDICTED: multidrug and toxin extrusion protein 1-like isoform X2 [Lepisosteus oculatus]